VNPGTAVRPSALTNGGTPPYSPRRRAEEQRLLEEYAHARDPAVLEELVERFLPLARRLASRFRGGPEPFEDLVQVASVGLLNAITRFDPSRGFAFTSFATPTILGELKRHFRDRSWSVYVDRGAKDRAVVVERAIEQLTQREGHSPSVPEIANWTELSAEKVIEAIEVGQAHRPHSLDKPVDPDADAAALLDRLGECDAFYDVVEYAEAIAPALDEFSPRDRLVLHLRFVEDMTQTEIAERIGVSQMQVSRILRSLLQRLRDQVQDRSEDAKFALGVVNGCGVGARSPGASTERSPVS
jgi:RNA polymerase sigma-B factor